MSNDNYGNFIENLVSEVGKEISIKREPNVYSWDGVKRFFADFLQFQFNVKLDVAKVNRLEDEFVPDNCLLPKLLYNITEIDGKKVIQFEVPEPSDEDDFSIKLKPGYDCNYMEVLKVLFFEFFSISKRIFLGKKEPFDYNQWNYRFIFQMLIPKNELSKFYIYSENESKNKKTIDIKKAVEYFNLNEEIIKAREHLAEIEGW